MFNGAIEDYTQAIKLQPSNFMHYLVRSTSYRSVGRTTKALQDLDAAVDRAGNNPVALMYRAAYYIETLEWAAALRDYFAALDLDPLNVVAENRIALILSTCPIDDIRDGEEATKHATKECELTKWEDYAAISTLAAAYAEQGDFGKAIESQAHGARTCERKRRTK